VCFQRWCSIPGSVQWSNPFRPWYEIAISLALYGYNRDHLPCLPWCNAPFGGNNKPLCRLIWPRLCLHTVSWVWIASAWTAKTCTASFLCSHCSGRHLFWYSSVLYRNGRGHYWQVHSGMPHCISSVVTLFSYSGLYVDHSIRYLGNSSSIGLTVGLSMQSHSFSLFHSGDLSLHPRKRWQLTSEDLRFASSKSIIQEKYHH